MEFADAFVEQFHRLLADQDLAALTALYAHGAEIVRYDNVATTPDDIEAFYNQYLANYQEYKLLSVTQLRAADDLLMWDALVDTKDGVLQVFNVLILDEHDLIRRHVPGVRGYWGAY